jgi:DNA mismatch endonuclease (patch repair protein)
LPKSRLDFWLPKLQRNADRDQAVVKQLEEAGWSVLTIWECELRDKQAVLRRAQEFLQ